MERVYDASRDPNIDPSKKPLMHLGLAAASIGAMPYALKLKQFKKLAPTLLALSALYNTGKFLDGISHPVLRKVGE